MDLTTTYLGLTLSSPVVASASPVSQHLNDLREVADAGVGAVVMYSLFEEQVRAQQLADLHVGSSGMGHFGEAADGYFPDLAGTAQFGTEPYIRHLERAASALDCPVIASLNGSTPSGWTDIARSMESAGAAALELNLYAVPGDHTLTGAEVEQAHLDILGAVKSVVSIPVAIKLSPYFSATAAMATALADAGADGLVLFNRFLQPQIDLDRMRVVPEATLSTPDEARLPRTWIAILRHQLQCSLAGTTGVETGEDVAAYILAGADVVMTASALLRHGPSYAFKLNNELSTWMQRKGYNSIAEARGVFAVPEGEAADFERAGYVRALQDAQGRYGALRPR